MSISDKLEGGLNMVDVESIFESVKATWVIRLLNATHDDIWTSVAKLFLRFEKDDNLIFKLNFTNTSFKPLTHLPSFYKEILLAYNKCKCLDYETFCDTIMQQPLWGNDHIVYDNKRSNETLFYKNWIDCNILKVSNLRFVNGYLDENYVYNVVKNKTNIYAEICKLKKALAPYRRYIGSHEASIDINLPIFVYRGKPIIINTSKSKTFYKCLVSRKICSPRLETYWKDIFTTTVIDTQKIGTKNFKLMKDLKLAEFKFKVLH